MSGLPITLYVPGIPAPQGSKRVMRGRIVEQSKYVKPWRQRIAQACLDADIAMLRVDIPVRVVLQFTIARPASHFRANGDLKPSAPTHPTGRGGDLDKLARAVHDALDTDAAVINNDSLIVSSRLDKRYGDVPGVAITISEVKP